MDVETQNLINKIKLNVIDACIVELQIRGHVAAAIELKEHREHVAREQESAIRYDDREAV